MGNSTLPTSHLSSGNVVLANCFLFMSPTRLGETLETIAKLRRWEHADVFQRLLNWTPAPNNLLGCQVGNYTLFLLSDQLVGESGYNLE